MTNVIFIASGLLALALFAIGVVFIRDDAVGYKLTAHEPAAITKVLGGRYIGLAMVIVGLILVGNLQALGVAFAVGAFLGFFDGIVTHQVGGKAVGHVAAGAFSAGLAAFLFSI